MNVGRYISSDLGLFLLYTDKPTVHLKLGGQQYCQGHSQAAVYYMLRSQSELWSTLKCLELSVIVKNRIGHDFSYPIIALLFKCIQMYYEHGRFRNLHVLKIFD